MTIDESKVNLLEKDIEEYIFQNPGVIFTSWGSMNRWVKRQFQVPSGIIDLLGVTEGGALAVVEIKNVAIDASALTQACRYAYDLERVICILKEYHDNPENDFPAILKIVIGRGIDTKTMREAEALKVDAYCFAVELNLSASQVSWKNEFRKERSTQYDLLREDESILAVIEQYEQQISEPVEEVGCTLSESHFEE